MNAEVVAAFFAGFLAVGSGWFSLWWTRRQERQNCEERMQAFKDGLHEQTTNRGSGAG